MDRQEEVFRILPFKLRKVLEKENMDFNKLQEIRLRINCPMILIYDNKELVFNDLAKKVTITQDQVDETMEYISNYSLYAFEDEIRQGFITISGGHRVGIAGKVIIEANKIKSMKHISFINIRLSHEITGCADKVMPYIFNNSENSIYHSLIISPPRCGKTTLLRDIIRQLSNGDRQREGMSIGVIDERSEIGACYEGIPQNDLGIRTDILDCCPKAEGMMMLIRSMSPSIIAVDEIGSKEEIEAIHYVFNCGCKLISTVHGSSIEDIKSKPVLSRLIEENLFQRYIILSNQSKIGRVESIYDGLGRELYKV